MVGNDAEIINRLEALNKRRNFSQADNDKVAVTQRFLQAFETFIDHTLSTKRCIVRVRKSPILKSEAFIIKHRHTTPEQFASKIMSVGEKYRETWESQDKKSMLHSIVSKTKLYQLADEKALWLTQL